MCRFDNGGVEFLARALGKAPMQSQLRPAPFWRRTFPSCAAGRAPDGGFGLSNSALAAHSLNSSAGVGFIHPFAGETAFRREDPSTLPLCWTGLLAGNTGFFASRSFNALSRQVRRNLHSQVRGYSGANPLWSAAAPPEKKLTPHRMRFVDAVIREGSVAKYNGNGQARRRQARKRRIAEKFSGTVAQPLKLNSGCSITLWAATCCRAYEVAIAECPAVRVDGLHRPPFANYFPDRTLRRPIRPGSGRVRFIRIFGIIQQPVVTPHFCLEAAPAQPWSLQLH